MAGWAWDMEAIGHALAGAAGGIVRALTRRQSLKETARHTVVGSATAYFIGPQLATAMDGFGLLLDVNQHFVGGFIVGLGGISGAQFYVDFMEHWRSYRRDQDKRGKKP